MPGLFALDGSDSFEPVSNSSAAVGEDVQGTEVSAVEDTEGKLRPMRVYDFEFIWLPFLANEKELMAMDNELFDFPDRVVLITMMQGYVVPFKVSEINVSHADLNGTSVAVWTFPEPAEDPLCRYMAFVPTEDGLYRLFTLERSDVTAAMGKKPWWIGEAKYRGHASFINVDAPVDAQGFVDMLKNLQTDKGISSSYK